MEFRASEEGERFEMSVEAWRTFARGASYAAAREKAAAMGIRIIWDCELPKTPEGYYQIQSGIDYAIAKSLAAAPFADILWMETKTADLDDARTFAQAIHAEFPDKMLAYNLSPSFNWDTTGMSDEEMTQFPKALGNLGYVFNFITYGGHQIDGLAAEEFAAALMQDGMLELARLQRKFRLLESPYRTPQTLVGGMRLDGALILWRMHRPNRDDQGHGKGLHAGSAPCADRGATEAVGRVARAVARAPQSERAAWGQATADRRLGVARTRDFRPGERQAGQRHIRQHSGSARPEHPLRSRPEHL